MTDGMVELLIGKLDMSADEVQRVDFALDLPDPATLQTERDFRVAV